MIRASRAILSIVCLLLILAPTGAAAQAEAPVYIVQEGDTLIGIAIRFGIAADDLAAANGLADPSAIFPGMRLRLPGFEGISGVLETRPVALGENLRSLSLRYGATPQDLARINRVVHPSRLYVGQPFIVPVPEGEPGPAARLVSTGPTDGPLVTAARLGVNPWLLDARNEGRIRAWILPGEPIAAPGDEASLGALPPAIASAEIAPTRPKQGDTAVVRVRLALDGALSGFLGERTLNFVVDDDPLERVALQGIHALAEPGLVDLGLAFVPADASQPPFAFVQPIRIDEGEYGRERLTVPPETVDPANTLPEDRQVAEILSVVTPERLWDGPFRFPSTYFETFPSFFGTRRNYNDGGWTSYHTGLDLYGNEDTQVLAPAPGVVVFAGPLVVRGNTTYIDHGWGVYTGYLHQSQIFVQPGDRVATGDVIGMVGATGRVTGAHLHWEVWVGGVPVQPLDWTERTYP